MIVSRLTSFEDSPKKPYSDALGELIILEAIAHSSSDGNLRKWRVEQCSTGNIYWLKSSSDFNGEEMFECESECFACELAALMGLQNIIFYQMDILYLGDKPIKVCVSEHYDFDSVYLYADVIPNVGQWYGQEKYNKVLSVFPDLQQAMNDLLLFDILIANHDRHLHNLGYNYVTNQILVFDNGAALYSNVPDNVLSLNLNTSFEFQRCRPFYDTVGQQIQLIAECSLIPVTYESLGRLIAKHIPEARRKFVTKLLYGNFQKVSDYYGITLLRK